MAWNSGAALVSPGSDSAAKDNATDCAPSVKDHPTAPHDERERATRAALSPSELIEMIDKVIGGIERQLIDDVAHAESSRIELQKTLEEIRQKQEATDKSLQLVD